MIDFLIRILPYIAPALRYADNPNRNYWRLDLLIFTVIVYVLDMIVAHLFFAPRQGERTVSHTLERTAYHSQKSFTLARKINDISPRHIKAVI